MSTRCKCPFPSPCRHITCLYTAALIRSRYAQTHTSRRAACKPCTTATTSSFLIANRCLIWQDAAAYICLTTIITIIRICINRSCTLTLTLTNSRNQDQDSPTCFNLSSCHNNPLQHSLDVQFCSPKMETCKCWGTIGLRDSPECRRRHPDFIPDRRCRLLHPCI